MVTSSWIEPSCDRRRITDCPATASTPPTITITLGRGRSRPRSLGSVVPRKAQQPDRSVFQLRVQLNDVHPVVWRRLLVPGTVRMAKLSEMMLAAMGWTNSHLHAFEVGDKRYGMCLDDYPEGETDEKTVTVLQALRDERRVAYEYDFGDGWDHDVVIESLTWSNGGLKFGVCLDGQNACPPEDVGGAAGYEAFLEVIANPEDEEHDFYLEWAGGSFDATEFDLAVANAALQRIR